jgi:hypothetical protein
VDFTPQQEAAFEPNGTFMDQVGAVRAQEIAFDLGRKGKLTVNGHDYMHEVGEYIYAHYGAAGVGYCRPYFDHACYNGLTLHMTSLNQIEQTDTACAAVSQDELAGCIHGGGHAALYMSQYDIPKALSICNELAAPYASSPNMLDSCAYGVFMEMAMPHLISPLSTSTAWYASPWKLRRDDPNFPCDDPRIKPEYEPGCWRMQGGAGNGMSPAQNLQHCLTTGTDDTIQMCIRGELDKYGIRPFTADYAYTLCDALGDTSWIHICLNEFIARDYMNGYDPSVASQICDRIDAPGKNSCEQTLSKYAQRFAP